MAVELEIRDGDPWWLSPNVWAVPGSNPEGSPGQPIAGTMTFLWARVRNNGSTTVDNAEVRFYWADPSAGFNRETAHFVGTSFISLSPGEVGDVLSLQPWVPEFVNGGHECILAEAFHNPSDPLPATLEFNVPTDRHVAQRNITVLNADPKGFFHFNFNLVNAIRKQRKFFVSVDVGTADQIKPLLSTFDPGFELPELQGKLIAGRFVRDLCPSTEQLNERENPELEVEMEGKRKINRTLIGRVEGGAALLHILQKDGEHLVGGLSLLVLPA